MAPAQARSVLVLRALDLGDMLCAVPALRAIRRGLPAARVTLASLPWARGFAARFDHLVDDFVEFPGFPGLPERAARRAEVAAFIGAMRARRFDLAIQLHGSGMVTNGLIALLGARQTAGFHPPGSPRPGPGFLEWHEGSHEVLQLLRLPAHLGFPETHPRLEFPRRHGDREEFERLIPPAIRGGYVVVHPGAKWASRRWPAARFAEVARALPLPVVLTGVAAEAGLCSEVARLVRRPVLDLAGGTSLGGFAEVLRNATLVLTNDTGASHLSAAVGAPSVVVSCGSDYRRWGPLDAARHRLLALDARCRPCAFETCPYGHECAAVPAEQVLAACLEQIGARRLAPSGTPS